MRLENLPDGGHVKVIWTRERSRDCIGDKSSRQRDPKTWWRRATATLLGVSFGSYRRRRRDVLMGRGGYVPLRRLCDIPLRRHWVFHLRLVWDVLATSHWDVVGCFIWNVPATSLGRTERRRYDVARTSCCWVGIKDFLSNNFYFQDRIMQITEIWSPWSWYIYIWKIFIQVYSYKHTYTKTDNTIFLCQ